MLIEYKEIIIKWKMFGLNPWLSFSLQVFQTIMVSMSIYHLYSNNVFHNLLCLCSSQPL